MEDFEFGGRDVDKAICSCGGEFKIVATTDKEEKNYGCGSKECCVRAIQCTKCDTRITLKLCAPDMNYED
jgi:hypothetical protein